MKFLIGLLFDIFLGRSFRINVDKDKSPGLHTFIQIMNFIGIILVLLLLGYFIFFVSIFKDYKGG